ncbi:MAG: hypothetical protein RLZZ628_3602, partial [Bacteroidota bacterium]
GAALNVKVFVNQKVQGDKDEYKCWGYRCYSMYIHQTILLENTSNCIEIGAKYTDIFGNEFNSYMTDYSLKIFDLRLDLPSIPLLVGPEPTLYPL